MARICIYHPSRQLLLYKLLVTIQQYYHHPLGTLPTALSADCPNEITCCVLLCHFAWPSGNVWFHDVIPSLVTWFLCLFILSFIVLPVRHLHHHYAIPCLFIFFSFSIVLSSHDNPCDVGLRHYWYWTSDYLVFSESSTLNKLFWVCNLA